MTALDWLIVVAVNGSIVGYGLYLARDTRTTSDWFLAARSLPWWIVGLSLFATAIDMINHLIAAEADHSLLKKLQAYQAPDLLVCDELGYLSLGQQGSHLFFQLISARHQHKSTVITTNLPFADWGKVFDSTTVATAIADRLVHHSEVLILGGQSYRRKLT